MERDSTWRLVKFPQSSAGISPLNSFATRRRAVTRPSSSVSTLCHSERASLLNQFVLFVQSAPPVAL